MGRVGGRRTFEEAMERLDVSLDRKYVRSGKSSRKRGVVSRVYARHAASGCDGEGSNAEDALRNLCFQLSLRAEELSDLGVEIMAAMRGL